MRINCRVVASVFIASIVFCHVAADTKVPEDTKTQDGIDSGADAIDPAKKGKAIELGASDPNVPVEPKGGEAKLTKANGGDQGGVQEHKGSDAEPKKEPMEERLPQSREKCDSPSNTCKADDNTLVACLRVPGNESPSLSLLIQNNGKGPRTITISAPESVKLGETKVDIDRNKDKEVTVDGLESGRLIELTAGEGKCIINFTKQYLALKKVDLSSDSPHSYIFKLTLSTGLLVLAVVLAAAGSLFIYAKFGWKYLAGKGPKYQKLDAELPISHGSKIEGGGNEGWDNSWEDNWDDEEAAPLTPSMPMTPSLSSKGMASRKFNKDAWND